LQVGWDEKLARAKLTGGNGGMKAFLAVVGLGFVSSSAAKKPMNILVLYADVTLLENEFEPGG
jgi:hypothetical protein